MKIALAGLFHETLTVLPGVTTEEEFEIRCRRGEDVITKAEDANTAMGGFIQFLRDKDVELLPIIEAETPPGPIVTDSAYEKYVGEICDGLESIKDEMDGLLLSLHGAMVTESIQDPETDLLHRIRKILGYETPIMVALDLHANLGLEILKEATAIFGYKKSPHIDRAKTGQRAAKYILLTIQKKIEPIMALKKPGLIVPSLFSATDTSPAKEIMAKALSLKNEEEVLDVSVFFGFAWADVKVIGVSVVAITNGLPQRAEEIVNELSEMIDENKKGLTEGSILYSAREGVALAIERAESNDRPVLILDHADREGDTTFVLQELILQGASNAALPLLRDPEAVQRCIRAGVGNRVEVAVGGKIHDRSGEPVQLRGTVLWTGKGDYIGKGPMSRGTQILLGEVAIIEAHGIWIQLTSRKESLIDEDPFNMFGFNALDFSIIVSKSKTHFRAVYEDLASSIIVVDAPGYGSADVKNYHYQNIPEGVYPITT